MKKWLFFIVLSAVTAGVIYATVNALRDREAASMAAIPEAGTPLVPGLTARLNDTVAIEGTHAGETYEVRRGDDGWVVPARAGYRADESVVRRLLIGVAGLKRLEPKTAKPELFERIGLVDPTEAASKATRLKALDASGAALFDVVFGTRNFAKGDSTLSEIYVRLGDEPQTWLVAGKVPEVEVVDDWVASKVVGIERERVARAVIEHADGATVTVTRESPDMQAFTWVEQPEGSELEQQWRVNDIANALAELEFDDVAKADDPVDGATALLTARMETFDGLRVVLTAEAAGEQVLGTLRAEVYETAEAGADMDSAGGDKATDSGADGGETVGEEVDVSAEAEQLNARWAGWRYTLPKYKADYLMRREADLVKPPGAPAGNQQAPAGNQGSTAPDGQPSAESLGLPDVFDLEPPGQPD